MLGTKLFRKALVYISVFSIILQALAPFSYVQLNSKSYAQEVTQTTNESTVTPASDEEEISANAFQNPIADATSWILNRKKISLLTMFILGGIVFFLYRRRKRVK